MEPTNFRTPARWNSVQVPPKVAERAYTRRTVDPDSGCWISTYSAASHGYAQVGWALPEGERTGRSKNRMVLAHRASWTHVNGQVPLGMTIDHQCKNRRCVNPDHMRLLPNFENARRISGMDWPIGQCANGHSADRLVAKPGSRDKRGQPRAALVCRDCLRLYQDRWNWKTQHPGEPLPHRLLLAAERGENAA